MITFTLNINIAFAEIKTKSIIVNEIDNDNEARSLGFYTHLSLAIDGGNGKIWATVKNDFTLFPANVKVTVQLYSSDTYQEYHTDMTLMSTKTIDDLNIGKSITVECSTDNVQKYWKARMIYKKDNGRWKSEVTKSLLYNADGTY